MIHINIQNTVIPALGFGTWKLRDNACVEAVHTALETGYRHIDTAGVYENEEAVGTALRTSGVPRDEIFLTTKIWKDTLGKGQLQDAAATALHKLQTDYVDLLLIHWPVEDIPFAEQIDALLEVKDRGMARLIGVSNFTVAQMTEVTETLGAPVACNQVEYHPYLSQKPVLDFVRLHDMFLTAYCPLAKGKTDESATLQEIGARYGKSAAQVGLRWLVQQDRVAAIPKAASPQHIRANFDIFDFTLSNEEMADISALARHDGRMVNPEWAPLWDHAA